MGEDSESCITGMHLRVSRLPTGDPEIFESIQGEGVSAGMPATFLRLAFCNLSCVWCDTSYTWNWTRFSIEKEVVALTVEEVVDWLGRFKSESLVVTGGEPLLQEEALRLVLLKEVKKGRRIEIETNGTLPPDPETDLLVSQWNVSPKLTNSECAQNRRIRPEVLKEYAGKSKAWFKFVIQNADDIEEAEELIEACSIDKARVILMPEGRTRSEFEKRRIWLEVECRRRNILLGNRLQIALWDGLRGR